MTSRRLRVGAFGVGRMGEVHVETLVRLDREQRIDFVALGDRHPCALSSASALVTELGGADMAARVERFGSADAMAVPARLDAVVVASRTEDHARDILSYTRHGIAVMTEKPMAGSVAEAAGLCKALGEAGSRLVQVAFQRHYDAAAQCAQKWFREGLIGRLQQSHHVLQDKNPTPAGYQSSGITADMAIHLVFEAMSFHGLELPRHVQALRFMAPHYDDRAGEGANVVHVFCTWADGAVAHLWGSRINNTGYDNGFTLIGTEGRIDVGEFVGDFGTISARLWRGAGHDSIPRGTSTESREFPMTRPAARHPDFYARYATAYADELRAFIEHVETGSPLEPGPDVGWKTLLVANVAEQSSRSGGRRIDLVLANGGPIATADAAAECAMSIGLA